MSLGLALWTYRFTFGFTLILRVRTGDNVYVGSEVNVVCTTLFTLGMGLWCGIAVCLYNFLYKFVGWPSIIPN